MDRRRGQINNRRLPQAIPRMDPRTRGRQTREAPRKTSQRQKDLNRQRTGSRFGFGLLGVVIVQITQNLLLDLLNYDSKSGDLTWKTRDKRYFATANSSKSWNTRYANKVAGYQEPSKRKIIRLLGSNYLVARIIWFMQRGNWPTNEIDHINGNPADNRLVNLRDVSHKENCKNQAMHCYNASGVTGVSWNKHNKCWVARIHVLGKTKTIGYYKDKIDAIAARKAAEVKYGYHSNHGLTTQERKRNSA